MLMDVWCLNNLYDFTYYEPGPGWTYAEPASNAVSLLS